LGRDDDIRELVIGDFGPRWRLLGFAAQNRRSGTVGPCYTNTDVSGQRRVKPREGRKSVQESRAIGTVVPRVFWLGSFGGG